MIIDILKDLPDGTREGSQIVVPDAIANVLILVGAAKQVMTAEREPVLATRRPYHRRDLTAEE